MHRSIATCHKVIITHLSFIVKYYLGYVTSSRRTPSCSSTGQITTGCRSKFGLEASKQFRRVKGYRQLPRLAAELRHAVGSDAKQATGREDAVA